MTVSPIVPDGAWDKIYSACERAPTSILRILEYLSNQNDGATVHLGAFASVGVGYDVAAQALEAFVPLQVVRPLGGANYSVDEELLGQWQGELRAAVNALRWQQANRSNTQTELLLAVAAGESFDPAEEPMRGVRDLRASVRSLIVECREELVLAAPFWDTTVAGELAELVARRLEAGTRVTVLARPASPGTDNCAALDLLAKTVGGAGWCDVRVLSKRSAADPFGRTTFHFKAAVADGRKAYLGSANFNLAGFGSRWELGVLLHGQLAWRVQLMLRMLCDVSEVWRPMERHES